MAKDMFLQLRWLSHSDEMFPKFYSFLATKTLTDVTLAVEDGKRIFEAHKLVLASASPVLHERLLVFPHKHIVIFFNDISGDEMEALLEIMYLGNVSVSQNNHESFLKAIKLLQIRGIVESAPIESLLAVQMEKPFPELNPNPERCLSAAYSPLQMYRENSPAPPGVTPVVAASSRLRRIPMSFPSSTLGFKTRKRPNSSSSNFSRSRCENGRKESYYPKKSSRKAAKESFTAMRTPVSQSGGSESPVRKRSRQHSSIPPVLGAEQETIDGKSAEEGVVQITILKCAECDGIFFKKEEFYQHVKAQHPFYIGCEENMMKKVNAYNCKFCDAIFQNKRHLSFHMSKIHHTRTTATTPSGSTRRNSVQEARDRELITSPKLQDHEVLTDDPKLRMTSEVRLKKLRPECFQEEKEVDTEDESLIQLDTESLVQKVDTVPEDDAALNTEDESGWETECDSAIEEVEQTPKLANSKVGLKCVVCGAIFTVKRDLCDHYLVLHPEIPIKKVLWEKRGYRYECRFCHISYAYFKCLQRHLQTNHPADGIKLAKLKPHPCDICGKGYVYNWQMQRHKTMKH